MCTKTYEIMNNVDETHVLREIRVALLVSSTTFRRTSVKSVMFLFALLVGCAQSASKCGARCKRYLCIVQKADLDIPKIPSQLWIYHRCARDAYKCFRTQSR